MHGEFLLLFFIGLVLAVTLMAVVWFGAVRIKNAGIVDIAWAGGFYLLTAIYALFAHGYPPRRLFITVMVAGWSLRLAAHLFFRVSGKHPKEDGRYSKLRETWGADFDQRLLWFFQLQAGLLAVLSVPFLLACVNRETRLTFIEGVGFCVWLVGVAGEAAADLQLNRFKSDPDNRGKTCQAGLWRYSRHPNYFFELVVWVGFFFFALGSPWGWLTVYCPVLMWHFLLRVTGVPATEEESLRTKGEEYRRYQQTTNKFVPWFPRSAGTGSPFRSATGVKPSPATEEPTVTASAPPAAELRPPKLGTGPEGATQFRRKPKGPV